MRSSLSIRPTHEDISRSDCLRRVSSKEGASCVDRMSIGRVTGWHSSWITQTESPTITDSRTCGLSVRTAPPHLTRIVAAKIASSLILVNAWDAVNCSGPRTRGSATALGVVPFDANVMETPILRDVRWIVPLTRICFVRLRLLVMRQPDVVTESRTMPSESGSSSTNGSVQMPMTPGCAR